MYEFARWGGWLVSPLPLALGLWLAAGLCLALHRRRWAIGLAAIGFVGLWLASTPLAAQALTGSLEARYPALRIEATPAADAIVVLGGALAGAAPPRRPTFGLGPAAGRVWHAAMLYRAGKARWIVAAAGDRPEFDEQQIEAEAIAQMLVALGVPPSAIRLETRSRNTRENAENVRSVLQGLGARRVLLVTSAQHMPRAVTTFTKTWTSFKPDIVPVPADIQVTKPVEFGRIGMWLPTPDALVSVTKALKEFAGLLALAIIGNVTL